MSGERPTPVQHFMVQGGHAVQSAFACLGFPPSSEIPLASHMHARQEGTSCQDVDVVALCVRCVILVSVSTGASEEDQVSFDMQLLQRVHYLRRGHQRAED